MPTTRITTCTLFPFVVALVLAAVLAAAVVAAVRILPSTPPSNHRDEEFVNPPPPLTSNTAQHATEEKNKCDRLVKAFYPNASCDDTVAYTFAKNRIHTPTLTSQNIHIGNMGDLEVAPAAGNREPYTLQMLHGNVETLSNKLSNITTRVNAQRNDIRRASCTIQTIFPKHAVV